MDTPYIRPLSEVIKELSLSPLERQAAEIAGEDKPSPPGLFIRIWSRAVLSGASDLLDTGGIVPEYWIIRAQTLSASPTYYDFTQQGGDTFTTIIAGLASLTRIVLPGTSQKLTVTLNTAFLTPQNLVLQAAAIVGYDPRCIL